MTDPKRMTAHVRMRNWFNTLERGCTIYASALDDLALVIEQAERDARDALGKLMLAWIRDARTCKSLGIEEILNLGENVIRSHMRDAQETTPTPTPMTIFTEAGEQRVRELAKEEADRRIGAFNVDDRIAKLGHRLRDAELRIDALTANGEKDQKRIAAAASNIDGLLKREGTTYARLTRLEDRPALESPAPPPDELGLMEHAVLEAARACVATFPNGGNLLDIPQGRKLLRNAVEALDAARSSSKGQR